MERFSGPIAAIMCASLLLPSLPAMAETAHPASLPSPARPAYKSAQMQGDERILHALNRFTFGPRPGDLEVVKAMGLDAWFNQQLHPASIDQTELTARLNQFPAMQRTPQDLLYYLPSNAVIRQAIDGKAPVPDRPAALHAIYADEMARVSFKRQEKEQQKQLVASNQPAASMAAPGAAPVIPAATISSPSMSGSMMADTQSAKTSPDLHQDGQMNMAAPSTDPVIDPATITEILALPTQQRISRLALMPQPQLDAFRKALKGPQKAALVAGFTPAQKEFVAALESPQRVVNEEIASQRLVRDIYSNAQLEEVMTDFWLNHFNVYLHKDEATPYYLVSYERDVIRPRALGKFEDLLEATAHSPAMLLYLDNSSSMGPDSPAAEKNRLRDAKNPNAKKKAPEGLNENYARELMELHTLGVNGGYTQADVTQVARVLTGWTVDKPQRGGGFKFDENRHEPGTKKVMGKKIKEHGEQEGRELLHMLATRPATAQFLSRKLAIRFVGDDPPQPLVDRMAKSYLSSGGDISTVLKTLFKSPEFWSEGDYRAKVKTPLEFVVSAARASNANTDNLMPLVNALKDMGMPLYGAIPPTGYKWDAANWVSTGALVNRMNFALTLASNKLPGIAITWSAPAISFTTQATESTGPAGTASITHTAVVSTTPLTLPTPADEEQRLESLLVAGGVSDSTRSAVLEQFQAQSAQNNTANNGPQNTSTLMNSDPAKIPAPPKPVQTTAAKPINPAQATAALEKQDQLLAGLLLGSPEFQRR